VAGYPKRDLEAVQYTRMEDPKGAGVGPDSPLGRPKLPLVGGYSCSCAANSSSKNLAWVPTRCAMPQWDAARFCRALGARRYVRL